MEEYFGEIKNVFAILFIITCAINLIDFRSKKKGKPVISEMLVNTLSTVFAIGWGIFYLADRIATGAELRPLNALVSILIVVLSVVNLFLSLKNRRLRKENEEWKANANK